MPEALTTWMKSGNGSQSFISKSTFLYDRQCLKLIWTAYNRKDLLPAPTTAQQSIFDQGHEIGALAKQIFPGGIEISADADGTVGPWPRLGGGARYINGGIGPHGTLCELVFCGDCCSCLNRM